MSLEATTGLLETLQPFFVYAAAVLFLVLTMLGLSYLLGQRTDAPNKNLPFESGIVSVGDAHFKISVHFYLTAILFIIFDLEVVFLFAWAVVVRDAGWLGFVEISVFIVILTVALVYLWRIGALDWRTQTQKRELHMVKGPGGVVNKKEFKL
ncbi:MAG: NADH-quinone oxidoreductase subunit A [Gammaproteobacteria bacterium]|nr:NADH-quinone oxidoreductase subunit A [Pseudomonadales bacterium]